MKVVGDLAKSDATKSKLRESILETVSNAFKSTSLSSVLGYLNLSTAEDLKKVAGDFIEDIDGDVVVFKDNQGNTKRVKVGNQEGSLDYGSVRGLTTGFAAATVASE